MNATALRPVDQQILNEIEPFVLETYGKFMSHHNSGIGVSRRPAFSDIFDMVESAIDQVGVGDSDFDLSAITMAIIQKNGITTDREQPDPDRDEPDMGFDQDNFPEPPMW